MALQPNTNNKVNSNSADQAAAPQGWKKPAADDSNFSKPTEQNSEVAPQKRPLPKCKL